MESEQELGGVTGLLALRHGVRGHVALVDGAWPLRHRLRDRHRGRGDPLVQTGRRGGVPVLWVSAGPTGQEGAAVDPRRPRLTAILPFSTSAGDRAEEGRLETDAGVVMLRDGFNDRITVFDSGKHGIRSEIIGSSDACFPEGFDPSQRMLWDFVDACRNDRDPEVDGAQALLLMELLQRFYEHRSALPSRWESFAGEIQ